MKASTVTAAILCLVWTGPCLADDLSFNDFGPWNGAPESGIFSAFHRQPTPIASMPNSGTASYAGATVGSLKNTATENFMPPPVVSVSNWAFAGSSALSADFSKQTFTATFQNFRSTDLASGEKISGLPWAGLNRDANTGSVTGIDFAGTVNGNSLSGSVTSTDFTIGFFPGTVTLNSSALNALFFGNKKPNSVAGTWEANATSTHNPSAFGTTTTQINAVFAAHKQ